ncbi:MAG: outer membrane beta-barrel protein [Betaproteobacteria bacterium]
MKKNESWGILALLLLSGLAAGPAAAQDDRGFYLGASLGSAKFRGTCTLYTAGTCDPSDTAYRLFGGYHLNPNITIEAGYGSVGEVFVNAVRIDSGAPVSFEGTLKAFDVSILPTHSFSDRFAVFGRLGYYRSQLEVRGLGGTVANESVHNGGFTFGLGLRFNFGRALGVRAEWQRYDSVGGGNVGQADIDYANLGLEMRF